MKRMYAVWIPLLVLFLLISDTNHLADSSTPVKMKIIAEWGGGERALLEWRGRVSVHNGKILSAESYKIESDERGVFEVTPDTFRVQSITQGSMDGAKIWVQGSLDTEIKMEISQKTIQFNLRDVLHRKQEFTVYNGGSRIIVQRDPIDLLQILPLNNDDLVFRPKEKRTFIITANPLSENGQDKKVSIRLTIPETGFSSILVSNASTGEPVEYRTKIEAPEKEGIYNLIAIGTGPGMKDAKSIVQFIVINPSLVQDRPTELHRELVDSIDCTKEYGPKRYWGDPGTVVLDMPLGRFRTTSLKGRSSGKKKGKTRGHMGWFAYRLKIKHPGEAHILEVSFPDDRCQTVGVSIFEPNAVGRFEPAQFDAGFYTGGEFSNKDTVATYSLIFWPRTREPIVIITNRKEGSQAAAGEIRVYEVTEGLPVLKIEKTTEKGQRLLGIYYEEPNVVTDFGGPEAESGEQSLTDWNTFYQAGRNMVDYLKYTGMNAVLLQSYGYQTSLYPSKFISNDTYRYDSGIFFKDGRDPIKKDILKLYLLLFEREGLSLIPSINFEQTLPELEALRSSGSEDIFEIDIVSKDGRVARPRQGKDRKGLAPWYDPIHPAVQQAILNVVTEMTHRYAKYDSLAGISIQHRGLSYVQYPGLDYGYGDYTVSRFEKETGIRIPIRKDDPKRFQKRYRWLLKHAKEQWIDWRCRQLHGLMLRIRDAVHAARSDLILYVSYMNTFQSILVSDDVVEWYQSGRSMKKLFRVKGLDPTMYMRDDNIVVTRPVRTGPLSYYLHQNGAKGYIRKKLPFMPQIDKLYSDGKRTGILVFHKYFESRLEDFDDVIGIPSRTWLVNTIIPFERNNLERYAKWMASLAPVAIFDGGWQVPKGGEAWIQEFAREFCPLPPVNFTFMSDMADSVVCRYAEVGDNLYFYLVNKSSNSKNVSLYLDPEMSIFSLSNGRELGKGKIQIILPKFALRSYRTAKNVNIKYSITSI